MITSAQISYTNAWLSNFRSLYHEGIPLRIHSRDIAADGSPEWTVGMLRWMTATDRRARQAEPAKLRVRRAMKQLHLRSLREYEVVYRVMIMGESLEQVTAWLNDRAIGGGHPERYTVKSTSVIVYAAVDKLCWYY